MMKMDKITIENMDFIFKTEFENRGNYIDEYYMENLDIDKEKFEYLYKITAETARNLGLAILKTYDDGSYVILEFKKIPCQSFIENGGFKNHFEILEEQKAEEKKLYDNSKTKLLKDLKPWYYKGEIVVPILLSLLALLLSIVIFLRPDKKSFSEKEIKHMIIEVMKDSNSFNSNISKKLPNGSKYPVQSHRQGAPVRPPFSR